ncbi:response regulator transcription factor [Streptomyces sp. NP160]|uniref:response regulator n=1 Tax=Streptomyces sp. NP160 TaxID=2586637 RepID=UPI00111B59C2|nr:response regulator transcription factor [Streptomyces sp. NP160]TNM68458.1 response regulator transcription factor [Streptomyces sp. NP160]
MRVLLCDDHPVFRDGLALLLAELGVEVVASVGTGEELLAVAVEAPADVAVVDLHLPGLDGVEVVRRLRRDVPDLRALVLSMVDDDVALVEALRAGAHGYLLKGARSEAVQRALAAVLDGTLVVDAALAPRLAGALARGAAGAAGVPFPQLTPREREVLSDLARGRSTEVIASTRFLSAKTVRNHVSSVLTKLGASDRAQAVAMARDAGLGGARGR